MFRFSIRDVLWLMVVVGLGVGWRVEHQFAVSHIRKLEKAWYDCLKREHPGETFTPQLPP